MSTKHDSTPRKNSTHQRLDGLRQHLITAAVLVAVIGFTFPEGAYAAPTVPDLTITVRVYNYAQTPSFVLAEAERQASRILSEAGLSSVWLECPIVPSTDVSQNRCLEPIEATNVRLRVLSAPVPNSLHDTVYGFAIAPALASVYYESALGLAKYDQAEFEAPIVLGCAIAHEIGHLLLGSNSHSISGVMSAHWKRKHVRQALMGAMLFSPEEARRMQAEVRGQASHSAASKAHAERAKYSGVGPRTSDTR